MLKVYFAKDGSGNLTKGNVLIQVMQYVLISNSDFAYACQHCQDVAITLFFHFSL